MSKRSEITKRVTEALKAQEASEWTLDKKIYNYGVVAQMGERLNGIQKVRGSIPLSSTNIKNRLSKPVFSFQHNEGKRTPSKGFDYQLKVGERTPVGCKPMSACGAKPFPSAPPT